MGVLLQDAQGIRTSNLGVAQAIAGVDVQSRAALEHRLEHA